MTHAFIIAFIVLFLHATSWDGMIFEGIKKIIPPAEDKHPNRWLYKPIYGCPICMTPWWGSAIYWTFTRHSCPDWLLTVGAASGISVIFVVFLTLREYLLDN